jgi:hypothetical protein
MKLLDKLPDEVKNSAVSFGSDRSDNYIWSVSRTIEILEILKTDYSKQIVLGGDILSNENGKVTYTYTSWHYDPTDADVTNAESIAKANEYLEQFLTAKDTDKLWVDLVIASQEEIKSFGVLK